MMPTSKSPQPAGWAKTPGKLPRQCSRTKTNPMGRSRCKPINMCWDSPLPTKAQRNA